MGIYNCARTLNEAIDCIIQQSYTNWEVIMCDDCSVDNTIDVAEQYVLKYPDKFVLLKNKKNQGLNYTLNRCLKHATGDYIARMDGDDLCDENRFQREVEVLENNPDIAIVSTDMYFFDENGIWGRTHVKQFPTKIDFLKGTPFFPKRSCLKITGPLLSNLIRTATIKSGINKMSNAINEIQMSITRLMYLYILMLNN